MNKIRPVLIGVAIAFLAVNMAYARGNEGPKDCGMGMKGKPKIFQELNLTEEQQKMMEDNRSEQRKARETLLASIKEEREKLQKALQDPATTKEQAESIARKLKSLQAEMVDSRIDAIFKVKAIMTPEQFARFNQMMEQRKGGKTGGRNGRPERRGKGKDHTEQDDL